MKTFFIIILANFFYQFISQPLATGARLVYGKIRFYKKPVNELRFHASFVQDKIMREKIEKTLDVITPNSGTIKTYRARINQILAEQNARERQTRKWH